MSRIIIELIGYMIIAIFGAVLLILGAISLKNRNGESLIMLLMGIIFLLIGVRGPIQFLRQEKRSEARNQDQNS